MVYFWRKEKGVFSERPFWHFGPRFYSIFRGIYVETRFLYLNNDESNEKVKLSIMPTRTTRATFIGIFLYCSYCVSGIYTSIRHFASSPSSRFVASLVVSVFSTKGKREKMEDHYIVSNDGHFAAVFDGTLPSSNRNLILTLPTLTLSFH